MTCVTVAGRGPEARRLAQSITSIEHRKDTGGVPRGRYRGSRHRSAHHRRCRRDRRDRARCHSRSARCCGRSHATPCRPARPRSRSLHDLLNRVSAVEGPQTRRYDSTSPDVLINVEDVERVDKNFPLDTCSATSYCCLPSKPRGLEVSRSSSGVLMGGADRPQDAASLSLTGRSALVRRSRARRPRSMARAGLGRLGPHRRC